MPINLILGFSVATLGFQVTLLLSNNFNPVSWQKCTFSLSLLLLVASVSFGISVVINRLRDFRATQQPLEKKKNSRQRKILSSTEFSTGNWVKSLGLCSGGRLELLVWVSFSLSLVFGLHLALSFYRNIPA